MKITAILSASLLALPTAASLALIQADASAAALSYVGVVQQDVDGATGLGGVEAAAVAPDGTRVYAVSLQNGAVVTFDRDSATGRLAFRQALIDSTQGGAVEGLSGAADVAVDPSGQHVYVASLLDDAVLVFARVAGGLVLTETDSVGVQGGPHHPFRVSVSPDGAHVYVATRDPTTVDAVLAFRVADASGRLAPVDTYSGIDDASALAMSPDGAHLYVADGSGVTVFGRDRDPASPGYGRLTTIEQQRNGQQGVQGMAGASAVAVDPSGLNVYIAGALDDAVVAFTRDAATGRLSSPTAYLNGTNGIDSLDGPFALAVSPDGRRVFAAGNVAHSLVLFRRDPVDGRLSFLESHRQGEGGFVDGLDRVIGLALSADGTSLYTVSPQQQKIGIFAAAAGPEADAADFTVRTRPGVAIDIDVAAHNGDPNLTLASFDAQSNRGGALTRRSDRAVTYQPAAGFHGSDAFAYTVSDGSSVRPGTVTVIVNTPPQARSVTATATAGTPVVILVTSNDSDDDGDAIEVSAVDSASAAGGTVTIEGPNAVRYSPPSGFTGDDSFSYTISDGLDTASATVSVTVQGTGGGVVVEPPDSDSGSARRHGGGGAVDGTLALIWGAMVAVRLGRRHGQQRK